MIVQNNLKKGKINNAIHSMESDYKGNLELLMSINPRKINYSIKETAEHLGVSYDFIREAIHTQKIKTAKFGDRYLIHVNELARILTEGV